METALKLEVYLEEEAQESPKGKAPASPPPRKVKASGSQGPSFQSGNHRVDTWNQSSRAISIIIQKITQLYQSMDTNSTIASRACFQCGREEQLARSCTFTPI